MISPKRERGNDDFATLQAVRGGYRDACAIQTRVAAITSHNATIVTRVGRSLQRLRKRGSIEHTAMGWRATYAEPQRVHVLCVNDNMICAYARAEDAEDARVKRDREERTKPGEYVVRVHVRMIPLVEASS